MIGLLNPTIATTNQPTMNSADANIINQFTTKTDEQRYNEEMMGKQYDLALNYIEDYYSSAVAGMQKAGLNPAMMYNSGVTGIGYSGTAPYNQTDTSSQRYYNKQTANANTINAAANMLTGISNIFDSIVGKKTYSVTKKLPNSPSFEVKGFGK